MTKNQSFKRLVRARMERTGERYSTARAHVLSRRPGGPMPVPSDGPALAPGVVAVGGQQPDLAAAANLVTNSGGTDPDGGPLSEAMAFGLAGGVGFLYGVFEYREGPTMTIVARNQSMPDPFCEPLFARAGAEVEIQTTGGAKKAGSGLDRLLADGRPALCTVGAPALAYLGLPADAEGMAPHVVGVLGGDGDTVLVDDRAPQPLPVDRAELDRARAAYRQGKHRLITVTGIDDSHDWSAAVEEAVVAGAAGFDTPPVPQFASNVGQAGLEKFHRLLVDPTDGKGWRNVFASGPRAGIGLSRLYDCIEHAYTAPSAGRPLYGRFLDQAAALCGVDRWTEAAGLFRAAGERWSQVASTAIEADPALIRFGELAQERAALLDHEPPDPALAENMARAGAEQAELVQRCALGAAEAADVYDAIHDLVGSIVDLERQALMLLARMS